MEVAFSKWAFSFSISFCLIVYRAFSVEGLHGDSKVRGVNLGGWLVIEGWIKPSLFDGIPNGDMLDGTEVQLKSVMFQKYVSAYNGGGWNVTVDRDIASTWETFRLWRVSAAQFQFRTSQGQFLTCAGLGFSVSATSTFPSALETFHIERNNDRVHLLSNAGAYLQATIGGQVTADFPGQPGWDDNSATFQIVIVSNNLHGDYQLANGYGKIEAEQVLKKHRNSFIRIEDFHFLYRHGINTVRIPVGWWIAYDPDPPAPYIAGSLEALDNAFSWAQSYDIRCIIDLHAGPGSQNGAEHSSSRDGSTNWPDPYYISQTLHVIDFLASRSKWPIRTHILIGYARHPALLGIELLNEPSAGTVPFETLVSYYKQGYQIVRKHSPTVYVIICQRIGNADPMELYQAEIGSQNLVIDLHYYNLFDAFFVNLSSEDNIQFIYKTREAQLQVLNRANGPLVFIGEWVNEWNVTNGSRMDYQAFGRAQLEVYNTASFGWAYWTLKNDRKHWDFEWNIRNSYLQLGKATKNQNVSILILLRLLASCIMWHSQIW